MSYQTVRILSIILLALLYSQKTYAQIVNVDPALVTAITIAGKSEANALEEINSEQKKIKNLQALANVHLKKIEEIQNKALGYLSNISAGVQNAYDIKKSYEITLAIAGLGKELKKAVIENPQGLITTAIATKYISQVTKEVAETYAYIASISLNKKTLLNSAERLEITWRVRHRLSTIYQRVYNLVWKIKMLRFSDLPKLLAPELYYDIQSQKSIAESVIRSYYGSIRE